MLLLFWMNLFISGLLLFKFNSSFRKNENLPSKYLLLKIKIQEILPCWQQGPFHVYVCVHRSRCLCTNTCTFTSLLQLFWKRAVPLHIFKGRTGTGGAHRVVAQPHRAPLLQPQRHQHLPAGPIGPLPAGTWSCSKQLHHPLEHKAEPPLPLHCSMRYPGEDSVLRAWDAMTEF